MLNSEVKIGDCYLCKVSGKLTTVKITRKDQRKGWWAINLTTGSEVRIKTAARLRGRA